jgi:predicted RNA-binding Zn ribbon-like protein
MSDPVFKFVGGAPCLDLANTLEERWSETPLERLRAYDDLLVWGRQGGLLTDAEVRRLREAAAARPAAAAAALARTWVLREAIHGLFATRAEGRRHRPADLATLNEALRRALPRRALAFDHEGFAWRWEAGDAPLDSLLGPVALSAAELLLADPRRVRICEARDCAWMFADTSKNHRRRWCQMSECGNREKARRFYERKKADR